MTHALKQRLETLQQENQGLLRSTQEKSTFLANMSHEIRTPLTSIIGFAESLLDTSSSSRSMHLSSVQTVIRNGDHLKNIVNDILDFFKIEAGKLEMKIADTSPFVILREVSDLVSLQAKNKGLAFIIDYQFPLPEKMQTDALRLKQILINLYPWRLGFRCKCASYLFHGKAK